MDAVAKEKAPGSRFTHAENVGSDFRLPEVDMAHAASLKPTRVKGKNAMWLVIFVSGAGVSRVSHASS